MAEERLALSRPVSMACSRPDTESPRLSAMSRRPSQKGASKLTLVLCPSMMTERLTIEDFIAASAKWSPFQRHLDPGEVQFTNTAKGSFRRLCPAGQAAFFAAFFALASWVTCGEGVYAQTLDPQTQDRTPAPEEGRPQLRHVGHDRDRARRDRPSALALPHDLGAGRSSRRRRLPLHLRIFPGFGRQSGGPALRQSGDLHADAPLATRRHRIAPSGRDRATAPAAKPRRQPRLPGQPPRAGDVACERLADLLLAGRSAQRTAGADRRGAPAAAAIDPGARTSSPAKDGRPIKDERGSRAAGRNAPRRTHRR